MRSAYSVLAGTPTLRHPCGQDTLEVGDMVMFPEGPTGAHQPQQRVDQRSLAY